MKFGTRQRERVVFFHQGFCEQVLENEKIILVLSPEFYWCRVFDLPVKTQKEALGLLPAFFEDQIPQGSYNYYCVKNDEGKFIAVAYDNDYILRHIKDANLSIANIKSVKLAQFEFETQEDEVVKVGDNYFGYVNSIFVKIPQKLVFGNFTDLKAYLQKSKASKHTLNFQFYKTILNKKIFVAISLSLLLFASMNFIKYLSYQSQINAQEKASEQLHQNYMLPATLYQLRSMLNSLHAQHTDQVVLRDMVDYLLRVKTIDKDAVLESFELRNKKAILKVNGVNQERLKRYIEQKFVILSLNQIEDLIVVEVAYE